MHWKRFATLIRSMSSNKVDLQSLRNNYCDKSELLLECNLSSKDPIKLFQEWLNIACNTPEIREPNAMCLATVNKDGHPSNRFVLLKDVSDEGFTFFTNYGSKKAVQIEGNNNVAFTLYWNPLHKQIRVEGTATKVDAMTSEKYFRERPRANQISACASPQSQLIPNREFLEKRENELKEKHVNEDVPMPNWGGYLISPTLIEFWQGQTTRLHDRIQFRKGPNVMNEIDDQLVHRGENGWIYERLGP